MNNKKSIFIILDGNAIVHRAYHALPPLLSKSGELVNAVYGFTLTLLSVLNKFHPEYIAASFDVPVPTFRHEKFSDYKATRAKAPDELYAQFPRVKELVSAFGIPIYEQAGFEADDCVGTLARQATAQNAKVHVIIVTGDNDALQLVDDRTSVFALRKGVKDTVLYDEAGVVAKYGFSPKTLIEFKGLRGDASDNISGVRGIGEKSATDLLMKYETVEGVYAHLEEIATGMQKKLEVGRDLAFLSRELGTIHTQVPLTLNLAICQTHDFDQCTVESFFRELGFFSLLKKIPMSEYAAVAESGTNSSDADMHRQKLLSNVKDVEKFFDRHKTADRAAFLLFPEKNSLFQTSSFVCDIAFQTGDLIECARVEHDTKYRQFLKNFFESTVSKTTYDMKGALSLLEMVNIKLQNVDVDVMIAGYLLDAGGNLSQGMLMEQYLNVSNTSAAILSSDKVLLLRDAVLEKIVSISKEQHTLKEKNDENNEDNENSNKKRQKRTLFELFSTVEMPLITVLYAMERAGVRLNASILTKLSEEMDCDLTSISKQIFDFAGHEFNISSPKQLSEVLFTELKIPTTNLRRTKTAVSTASPELAKLKGAYPIVALVEDYRERFKLKTTYLDVLPRLTGTDGRIHTTFHQTIAATGRLSSADPNLQNIPIRSQWGEHIRSAFEAEKGKVFVGADYSQIELRIAAHLSGDKAMCAAFAHGEDIHRRTATLVYHVKPDAVTSEMRSKAKVFNFGILYGMGRHGLAQATGMTRDEASVFIAQYFEHFCGIKVFMDDMKACAHKQGFVETELGRRRFLPDIASDNHQIVASAERMAINMPVQGLEADIVKLAMIASDTLITEMFTTTAKLLLQIHDELIFEVDEAVAPTFAKAIKNTMESVYHLRVPLIVDVSIGKNWGEI